MMIMIMRNCGWLPGASTTSGWVDLASLVVFSAIGLVSVGVVAAMVLFAIRYRRRDGNRTGRPHTRASVRRAEIGWSTVIGIVFLGFFVAGAVVYDALQRVPEGADAVDITVTAKRWMWRFQQPTGRREVAQLHVPAGRVIRLHLISEDVIHSFFVPAFRLKQDVVPGWARMTWFEASTPGVYALACAEYCGTEHARMRAEVVVMEPQVYDAWLVGGEGDAQPLAAAGRELFERYDCGACHEAGLRRAAPPLVGVYGSEVVLQGGRVVVADDAYIRRSMISPAAEVVAGYEAEAMPSYAGIVTDEELLLLVAYVRSLGERPEVHR